MWLGLLPDCVVESVKGWGLVQVGHVASGPASSQKVAVNLEGAAEDGGSSVAPSVGCSVVGKVTEECEMAPGDSGGDVCGPVLGGVRLGPGAHDCGDEIHDYKNMKLIVTHVHDCVSGFHGDHVYCHGDYDRCYGDSHVHCDSCVHHAPDDLDALE